MLEVSVDDILSLVYNNAHIYIHAYSDTLTTTHLHKVLPPLYYSCHFVISSHHKSYQQYFEILLNYEKPEIYRYKKKEK